MCKIFKIVNTLGAVVICEQDPIMGNAILVYRNPDNAMDIMEQPDRLSVTQDSQQHTGCNSGAHHTSYIGCHGMHKQEIGFVVFLPHNL